MNIDTQLIKDNINVRDLIGRDLGKKEFGSNVYDAYKCPLHNESKGHSLVVYEDHWTCFGKCNKTGDAITWMMDYHRMVFSEACTALLGNSIRQSQPRPRQQQEAPYGPPSEEWQMYTRLLVEEAKEILWSDRGKPALDYLMNVRGLWKTTIEEAQLGYYPGGWDEWKPYMKNVWRKPNGKPYSVPCGIIIPHFANGHLWAVRSRRAAGPDKYQAVSGGVKMLYWSDGICPGWNVLIAEGEFDTLITHQCAEDLICPVALCSASNFRINRYWWSKLVTAEAIYVRLDDDMKEKSAYEELGKISNAAHLVQVPQTKDINDYYLSAGSAGFRVVRDWIREILGYEPIEYPAI